MSESREVLVAQEGSLGHITLNRPEVLNALNVTMVRRIKEALHEWETNPAVRTVLLDGSGDRGLCAGGDLRDVLRSVLDKSDGSAQILWEEEYQLDLQIAQYSKPYVALMDGLVMGGGVGLSAHGRHRIVTERTQLSMPEVAIGLFPDVGATFLLARAPGEIGTHVGLTGSRIGPTDVIACGLADHLVVSSRIPSLIAALRRGEELADVLSHKGVSDTLLEKSELLQARRWIDECYAGETVEVIVDRLRSSCHIAAQDTAAVLEMRSPTALKITLRALRDARKECASLGACLERDYRIVCSLIESHDLAEGIRAMIVDKDRNPRWQPSSLQDVSDNMVEHYFLPRVSLKVWSEFEDGE